MVLVRFFVRGQQDKRTVPLSSLVFPLSSRRKQGKQKMNTYYIGGSPCAGKSTVAEILSKKYNLYYFKVDDFLDGYTKLGALKDARYARKRLN